MLQDGVGAQHATIPEAANYFQQFCNVCKIANRQLWADTEIFQMIPQYVPSNISRVIEQIQAEQNFVSQIVFFEFTYYMSPLGIEPGNGSFIFYGDYVDAEKISSPLQLISHGDNYTLLNAPTPPYLDSNYKLTDGISAFNFSDQVGWCTSESIAIILNLGIVSELVAVRAYFMYYSGAAVYLPTVTCLFSTDNVNYSQPITLNPITSVDNSINVYFATVDIGASYIKFIIVPNRNAWTMCSQIEAYITELC